MDEPQPEQALTASIEAAYVVFSRYPRRHDIDACPCCVTPSDKAILMGASLRELTCEQLAYYAFKAMTTWGEVDDYRHFLPRVLELAATDEAASWPGLSPDLIAQKLLYGGFETWPRGERAAIHDYLDALWQVLLRTISGPADLEEVFEAQSVLGGDTGLWLRRWAANEELPAASRLAELVKTYAGASRRAQPELAAWLAEPERRDALEAAFWRYADHPEAAELSAAVDLWVALTV